jgi:hypothetical protein
MSKGYPAAFGAGVGIPSCTGPARGGGAGGSECCQRVQGCENGFPASLLQCAEAWFKDSMQFLASLHRSVAALTTPGTADTITAQDASSGPRAEAAARREEQQEAPPNVPPRPDFGPQAAGVHAAAAAPAAAAGPAAVPQLPPQQQDEPVDGGQEQPLAELPAGYNPAVEQLRQQEFRRLEGRVYAGKPPPPPARLLPGGPAYRSSCLACRHCC